MKYITGIHALNLPCTLDTTGDWHQSALRWKNISWKESEGSLFDSYGIEQGKKIPEHEGRYAAANTIRAVLDLLEEGNFAVAQGVNRDYIGNSKYDQEFFEKVWKMQVLPHWAKIDAFMGREYAMKWVRFKEKKGWNQEERFSGTLHANRAIDLKDINQTVRKTVTAYISDHKLEDLYDIIFICKKYFLELTNDARDYLKEFLKYEGTEQLDYLIYTQKVKGLDTDQLTKDFADVLDMLGIIEERGEASMEVDTNG